MGLSADKYVELLKGLLPRGIAWPRGLSTYLHKVLLGISDEMARYDERVGTDLVNEADPRTTLELLTDWERVVALPDPCQAQVSETVELRQDDVIRKLTAGGGQSKQFFKDVAAGFGYDVTVENIFPFRSGRNRSGDRCYDVTWKHHWKIIAPSVISKEFRSGQSRSGDRLRVWRNDVLECAIGGGIQSKKPAHTIVHFVYGG